MITSCNSLSNTRYRLQTKLSKIKRILFTPGGRHLMVDSMDASGKRALRVIPLVLTANELTKTKQPRTLPAVTDEELDLAILKIESAGRLPVVRLSTAVRPEVGESVWGIGHPGQGSDVLDYTMTQGIVSNPNRSINDLPFIQTSAAVNPGSSGAPMLDDKGNVIGVVTLKASIEGAGFAVPISRVLQFIKSLSD